MSVASDPATARYNGWCNWETWNVNLWVMSEDELYEALIRNVPFTLEAVEAFVLEAFPNGTPDMHNAMSIEMVDFQELADTWNLE